MGLKANEETDTVYSSLCRLINRWPSKTVRIALIEDLFICRCEGGSIFYAWVYAKKHGVCSGGRYGAEVNRGNVLCRQRSILPLLLCHDTYHTIKMPKCTNGNSSSGTGTDNYSFQKVCKPYVFHPCGRHQGQKYYGECPKHMYKTPVCKRYCQYGYGKRYENDKFYGNPNNRQLFVDTECATSRSAKAVYGIFSFEPAIQMNIMKNGPVQAAFTVYEDFAYYKSGVYVVSVCLVTFEESWLLRRQYANPN